MNTQQINFLTNMNIKSFNQISNEKLEKIYDAYLLKDKNDKKFVLKKATEKEYLINQLLIKHQFSYLIPELIHFSKDSNQTFWITTRYFSGKDLSELPPHLSTSLGSELANLVNYFYHRPDVLDYLTPSIDEQLSKKTTILNKIDCHSPLFKAYSYYLNRFKTIPKTLCHDDLLPINLLYNNNHSNQLKIIDWEHATIGSYLTDITRLTTFYSANRITFNDGLTFYGNLTEIDQLISLFYQNLSEEIKCLVTKEQFLEDYHFEKINQLLLTISYLDRIHPDNINNNWEKYFFNLILESVNHFI